MKIIKKTQNGSSDIKEEFNVLKKLKSPYLINLQNDSIIITNDTYCLITEFCEVFLFSIFVLIFKVNLFSIKSKGVLKNT